MDPARVVHAGARLRGVPRGGLSACARVRACARAHLSVSVRVSGSPGGRIGRGQWEASGLGGGFAEGAGGGAQAGPFLPCRLRLPQCVQQGAPRPRSRSGRRSPPSACPVASSPPVLTQGQGNASAFQVLVRSWPLGAGGPQPRLLWPLNVSRPPDGLSSSTSSFCTEKVTDGQNA